MNHRQPVTYIDDIEDNSNGGGGNSTNFQEKIDRETLDRNAYNGPLKSKMRNNVDMKLAMNAGVPESVVNYFEPSPQNYRSPQPPPQYNYGPKVIENNYIQDYEMPRISELHCLDIVRHINTCPICSRFYENDKSSYVIFIVILIIVILILLKKFLELRI